MNATSWVGSTGSGERVALQTALGVVNDNKESVVRVLFETGSQKSFITAKSVSNLGLEPLRKDSLSIKAFGRREAETEVRDMVKLSLGSIDRNKKVSLECFVVS